MTRKGSIGSLTWQFNGQRMVAEYARHYLRGIKALSETENAPYFDSFSTASRQTASDGYIILDMPEEKKAGFHDLLKGFEEYAELKGYRVCISVDASTPQKLAFKFTLADSGVCVSTERVRQDLREYAEVLRHDELLDELLPVLSQERHEAVLFALKNRIVFLQHTARAQKNVIEFYEGAMRRVSEGRGVVPAHNFYISGGGLMSADRYTAIDSPQAVQGIGHEVTGNTLDKSVRIGLTFKARTEQIEKLDALVKRIQALEYIREGECGEVFGQSQGRVE
jgi:hypothetical protein